MQKGGTRLTNPTNPSPFVRTQPATCRQIRILDRVSSPGSLSHVLGTQTASRFSILQCSQRCIASATTSAPSSSSVPTPLHPDTSVKPADMDTPTGATDSKLPPEWSLRLLRANLIDGSSIGVPKTWNQVFAVFCLHPTPIFVGIGIMALACVCAQSELALTSALGLLIGACAWIVQEWFIHAKLFHGNVEWFGKTVHTEHHNTPYHHITIDDLTLVAPAMVGSLLIFTFLGGSGAGTFAALAYWSMGLFYIFSHYLVHTRLVPKSRYWRQMRQHHMQHHCRSEEHWLSFTITAMDSFMGTNPAAASVPMTAMARAAIKNKAP